MKYVAILTLLIVSACAPHSYDKLFGAPSSDPTQYARDSYSCELTVRVMPHPIGLIPNYLDTQSQMDHCMAALGYGIRP